VGLEIRWNGEQEIIGCTVDGQWEVVGGGRKQVAPVRR
jgi:hypothetical protein